MVSVVITNFNYAEFVGDAIESALAQRGAETEVVVVDDGSTDGSRALVQGYEGRVTAVLKQNGGQASAFNAGFRASRGDIIIFLDADDVLLPRTAERVSQMFAHRPETAKVHYRLEVVDAEGRPTGAFVPPLTRTLPDGDIRERLLRAPDDIPYPPTSGNAFAAAALRRLLPMPEAPYTRLADVYLVALASLLGPVARLDDLGGRYRFHTRNLHYGAGCDLERIRATVRATSATHEHLTRVAASLGIADGRDFRFASVTDLAQRLVSRRLEPAAHPIASDRPAALAARGVATALTRSTMPFRRRLTYAAWFTATALAPRRVAHELAERLFEAWWAESRRQPPV
jgi:glycosyltransferase involved in cell wall biosynthesis